MAQRDFSAVSEEQARKNMMVMTVAALTTLFGFALPWVRFESSLALDHEPEAPGIRRTPGERRQTGGSLQPGYLRRSQVSAGPRASGAASAASNSPVSTAPPNAMDGSGKKEGAPSSR
jgi:hypothetical protein